MNDESNSPSSQDNRDGRVENMEQFLLHGRGAIIQKLRQLGKGKNLITAHFGGGKYSLLTAVVDVLPDKDLLVLDYGADETMNKKILSADRIVFKTQHQGITAQFTVSDMKRARLRGKTAFACSLPDSLLWVQRREFYRVSIPRSDHVTCTINSPRDEAGTAPHEYPLLDISIGGLALHATRASDSFEPGQIYAHCHLQLPAAEPETVALEVQNILPVRDNDPAAGLRIGCRFVDLHPELGASIQRYIHTVDAMKRRVED